MSKKKEHRIRKKTYNDLCSLKNEIEASKVEKVIEFAGHTLVTDKNHYTLFDSVVYKNGEPHGTN